MMKGVRVTYPKKKPRLNLEDLGDVSEPERCSMYQVLLNNLKISSRATFLHRIIYVGAHRFPSYEEARILFSGIITKCNETYSIEKLSGFLLFYSEYIVHMVEGDEDNLNKHLRYLLNKNADHYPYLKSIKLLIHVSNINQRFFQDWIHYTGTPSKLLEKLDLNADLEQSGRLIYNCIKRLYSLYSVHSEDIGAPTEALQGIKYELETTSSTCSPNTSRLYASYSHGSNEGSSDPSSDTLQRVSKMYLPECEILDFVINSNFTMKLQEYFDLYGVVPMRDIYKDRVWPVPHDFIPYDIFEKPFDCTTELPKELRMGRSDLTPISSKGSSVMDIPKDSDARLDDILSEIATELPPEVDMEASFETTTPRHRVRSKARTLLYDGSEESFHDKPKI